MTSAAHDEVKNAIDNLRKAADVLSDRMLGKEVTGHLREAAKSGIRAAKAVLDEAEKQVDGKSCSDKTSTDKP